VAFMPQVLRFPVDFWAGVALLPNHGHAAATAGQQLEHWKSWSGSRRRGAGHWAPALNAVTPDPGSAGAAQHRRPAFVRRGDW